MKQLQTLFTLSIATASVLTGCVAEDDLSNLGDEMTDDVVDELAEGEESDAIVAHVVLDSGVEIEFFETEPGALDVIGHGPAQAVLDLGIDDSWEATTVYQHVTGDDAPDALVDAELRMLEGMDSLTADDVAEENIFGEADEITSPPQVDASISSATFAANYCSTYYDFLYCWTYRTGNGYVTRKSHLMKSWIHDYSGTFRWRYSYKSGTKWYNVVDRTLHTGDLYWAQSSSFWDRYRSTRLYDASGDIWHMSAYGFTN